MTDPAMKAAGKVNATGIHTGAIRSIVGGRTDHHPMKVPSGSYVVPADVVSGLGQGNTENGMAVLEIMFPKPKSKKSGGEAIPIMAAGGEVVLSPEQLKAKFGGDLDHAHKAMDKWVIHTRQKVISTLKGLPGPAQD